MPKVLSQEQIRQFEEEGAVRRVRLMSRQDAIILRQEIERFENRYPNLKGQMDFKANRIMACVNQACQTPRLLDIMEDLLGPDLLLWNATFRIKQNDGKGHADWHQDTAYIKLKPLLAICWMAINDVPEKAGCLQIIPGSHKGPLLSHREGDDPDSILSRAQYIDQDLDTSSAISLPLEAGEACIFNHAVIHASGPNTAKERRIGLLMDFLPTSAIKQGGRDTATLVRGEDHHGHFDLETTAVDDDPYVNLEAQKNALRAITATMYEGSAYTPKGLTGEQS